MYVLKLVKLIYLSDRLSMERYGLPITYDDLVSMRHGPVPSRTLNLINGDESERWDRWIAGRENHQVCLAKHDFDREDLDELSEAVMEIIDEIWDEFGSMNQWELRDYTHEHCPEWEDPQGSSRPIREEKIFTAFGWSDEQAREAQEAIEEQRYMDRFFSKR